MFRFLNFLFLIIIYLGSTLECLIDKLVNVPKDPQKAEIASKISQECRQEVMRIAELQSDDFHLDRPLYFACRKDREQVFNFYYDAET